MRVFVHFCSYFTIKKFVLQLFDRPLKKDIYMLYYIKKKI